jgi:phenylacetate-coenzyme A ligase PaaK-like adenylate-forming protein
LAEIIASFSDLGEFPVEVTRENDRDFMNLKLEIDDINNSEEIAKGLEKKIKEVLRVKADRIEFVAKGTLKSEHKFIDRRAWK